MIFKRIKKNARIIFGIVLPVLALVFLFYFFLFHNQEIGDFKANARRLLEKSENLAIKAQSFDQASALKSLGETPINGFYYRFDDRLDQAVIDRTGIVSPAAPYLLNVEFDERDTLRFQSKKERFSISDGILTIKHSKNAYFEAVVDIPYNQVGKIEIRARHSKGKILRLGWSKKLQKKIKWKDTGFADIDVIPDNQFHIYTIEAKHVLSRKLSYGSKIKAFYLFASDINGDRVDIDYIRFITKKGDYLKKTVGVTCDTRKTEMRKVLFTQTPLSITYELELPEEDPVIAFGTGVVADNDPVTFNILINTGSGPEKIFSKQVISTNRWHDAKINMSPYSGKKIKLIFKTESEKGNIALWSNPILYTGPKEKFNVIIVLEDALRADHMSCYGYHRETTPVKERFAKKGVLFLNAFAQATKTRPSCPSIMTSLHPTATRVWKYFERLHENYLTLAEILRYTGFQTAAFIQNPNAGPSLGLHQGFSYLFSVPGKDNPASYIYGKKIIKWIKSHNESNYFLYLHLLDPHSPYDPPGDFRHWYYNLDLKESKLSKQRLYDPEWVTTPALEGRRARYDGEIKNNDFYLERFLTDLEKLNALEHTLIVFIADHGEHLGEHNLWGHNPPGFIQVIKTPLIMVYPKKLPANLIVTQPVQNIDIVPTILDLLKINKDNLLLAGDSLLSLVYQKKPGFWNNRIIVSDEMQNRTKRDDQRALASIIFKDTHILCSDTYPLQQFNYWNDKQEIKGITVPDQLKVTYKTLIRELQKSNFAIWQAITKNTSTRIKYDPKTIERLKSLGYIN